MWYLIFRLFQFSLRNLSVAVTFRSTLNWFLVLTGVKYVIHRVNEEGLRVKHLLCRVVTVSSYTLFIPSTVYLLPLFSHAKHCTRT